MEATPENLQVLTSYLNHTLSPTYNVRKPAEEYLTSVEGTQNYGLLLLQLADCEQIELHTRMAAAVTFKNFVKRNWRVVEDQPNKISPRDRELIKKHIVGLMLKTPEVIQRQLSDGITNIGSEDFPNNWQGLLQEMVEHFKGGDFYQINGVLRTAHSLTKRYRHEFKSQELWTEIKFVLETFAAPFTDLFQSTMQLASRHSENPQALQVLFSSLLLICKVFFSLTAQELPDQFAEKNLEMWMDHFHTLLTTYKYKKLLETDDDEEAGPLEKVKSQICEVISMFAQKYDEDFSEYLPKFVQSVWNLLVTTDAKPKHDLLVSSALEFLASVSERPTYKDLFADETTLTSICEKVIVPNMYFRESDEELFEDNPEEYLRRDLEGSDIGTRRYLACNLVRGLCKFFEGPVTAIFSGYITAMLQQYGQDPAKNWKAKDAALYLISAIATRSKTTKHGITKTSELVNVAEILQSQCLPELQKPTLTEQAVLRADSIRYLTTFRSVLPRELLVGAMPLLSVHLTAPSHVLHTYAAHCIEKLLILRGSDGTTVIKPADLKPHFETLISRLLGVLRVEGSEQNEYVMKAIMRSMSTMQEDIAPYSETLLKELSAKLALVSENPTKPHFNHYLFESICCVIRFSCRVNPKEVEKLESSLFPIIERILVKDVSEFLPYLFQILSLLLELRPLPIPQPYMVIFPLLLTPALWEHTGNIPALVRLLQAFIEKAPADITKDDKILALLGVFQKLIASKVNDHQGFYLLGSLVEFLEASALASQLKNVFMILFQRLQNSKTTKYVKGLLVFFSLFAGKYGGSTLVETVDSIQPKLFQMVIERLFIPDVQKVTGSLERKICAVGMTKLLAETPAMLSEPYVNLWGPLLHALISLFELPEDDSLPDDEHFIEIEDTPGYQTAYSQLVFAGTKEHDPFGASVPNAKIHLAQSLLKLSSQYPGKLQGMISSSLSNDAAQFLQAYLQSANISTLM